MWVPISIHSPLGNGKFRVRFSAPLYIAVAQQMRHGVLTDKPSMNRNQRVLLEAVRNRFVRKNVSGGTRDSMTLDASIQCSAATEFQLPKIKQALHMTVNDFRQVIKYLL